MQENNVRGVYIPIEIKPGTLGPALESLPKLGFKGVNLTMPLKQEAIAIVDELDPVGKLMGAVSCIVVRRDNSLLGVNNDWIGFRDNLNATFPGWKSTTQSALVLGAGGGGLAIVYALVQEGLKQIFITNRSQERAEQIADIFKDEHIIVRPWSDRHSLVAESDLIVNTTNPDIESCSLPTLSHLSVSIGPGSRLRHWCSFKYLRISPLHLKFHFPLPYSSQAVSNAIPGLSPGLSHPTY